MGGLVLLVLLPAVAALGVEVGHPPSPTRPRWPPWRSSRWVRCSQCRQAGVGVMGLQVRLVDLDSSLLEEGGSITVRFRRHLASQEPHRRANLTDPHTWAVRLLNSSVTFTSRSLPRSRQARARLLLMPPPPRYCQSVLAGLSGPHQTLYAAETS
jgi:hypothetical protein